MPFAIQHGEDLANALRDNEFLRKLAPYTAENIENQKGEKVWEYRYDLHEDVSCRTYADAGDLDLHVAATGRRQVQRHRPVGCHRLGPAVAGHGLVRHGSPPGAVPDTILDPICRRFLPPGGRNRRNAVS